MKYNIAGAVRAYGKNSGLPTAGLVKAFKAIEDGYVTNGLNRIKSKVLRIITAECTQSVDGYIYGSNNEKIMKNSCLPPKWIGIKNVGDFRDYMDNNGLLVTDLFPIAVVSEFYRSGKVKIGSYLQKYSEYQADRIADIITKNGIKKVVVCSRYVEHISKTNDFEELLKKAIFAKGGNPAIVKSHKTISGKGGFLDTEVFEVFRTTLKPRTTKFHKLLQICSKFCTKKNQA